MKKFFRWISMLLWFPGITAAQVTEYSTELLQCCDGVQIHCLYQVDDVTAGSCILQLPNDMGGMTHRFEDDQVIEFGEVDSMSYQAKGDWTDIIHIRDDFLKRNGFAPWNGAEEMLPSCLVFS